MTAFFQQFDSPLFHIHNRFLKCDFFAESQFPTGLSKEEIEKL
jgi:hypothetical protein